MKFSIITPARNGLDHLRRCIGSVRGQVGMEAEHLVMDGGSTDGTVAWLTQWQSGRSLEWTSGPDRGMYDAIDKGWERAQGDVLSWLNCDEQYLPGTLARVAEAFASDPSLDVVFGDTLIVAADGSPVAARREIPLRAPYVKNGFLYALSCSTFFRRRLWDQGLLRLDNRYRYAADMDLMLRLLANGKKVSHVPFYFGLFGVDGGNASSTRAGEMAKEIELVRQCHDAQPPALRLPYRALRCLERLLRGCYRSATANYAFALDEEPHYRQFQSARVGFRFTYARAARRPLAAGTPSLVGST